LNIKEGLTATADLFGKATSTLEGRRFQLTYVKKEGGSYSVEEKGRETLNFYAENRKGGLFLRKW